MYWDSCYQEDWAKWLPFAEFVYNNRKHSATGVTPFYAEYGYHLTFSIDPVASSDPRSSPGTGQGLVVGLGLDR